jgi:predicted AlkP superfamily pyrophosphatase or phosphodiesterase
MATRPHRALLLLFAALLFALPSFASAYDGRPRLIVIVIVDQLRGDYLARYQPQFGSGGFNLFLERGAVFTDCRYDYASTRTAPGHSTLVTGSYVNGHGILSNVWWDAVAKRTVLAVRDDDAHTIDPNGPEPGAGSSPHFLLATTLGDELKLATQGKARVFALSMKNYAAILSAGHAADAAYWADRKSGAWVTSSFYRNSNDLPQWVAEFDRSQPPAKYLAMEWKDAAGKVLRGPSKDFDALEYTPFATDYELDFARALVENEKLGQGPATDLLVISVSADDFLGHEVGPDSPQVAAMTLALDRQLSSFFRFLGQRVGLANLWLALSADHGIAPLPAVATGFRLPGMNYNEKEILAKANAELSARFSPGRSTEYVTLMEWPIAFLSPDAFAAAGVPEAEAERAAGEAFEKLAGWRGYVTRAQQAQGQLRPDEYGRKYAHSYSAQAGWYVIGEPTPFTMSINSGTDHSSPYSYDTHVPLAFFGAPFRPGTYRGHAEPVDLAPTLSSLLGISPPSHSVGRVLTEALAPATERPKPSSGKGPR